MDGEHLIYLYCVMARPPDLQSVEGPPGGLYLVHEVGLWAVVSQVEASQFGPSSLRRNLEDLDWVVAETTKHEKIVEAVMRDRCVVPFRFATLFHTDESLRTRLRTHAQEFMTLLEELEDKAEWGVKVHCDVEGLRSVVRAQDGSMSHLNEALRCASPGKAYFLEKKRGDLAIAALGDRIDRCVGRVVETLQTVSFQMRINKVWFPRATRIHDSMILNAACLVGNDNVRIFVDAANALKAHYADQSVLVECTGPWPPYNFCDLAGMAANE